ncbi:permease [Leptospira harrisiae]|uniref:permease n=1 Tax=Leptospira harrisiae TaxID=2023189 RepID=UPI001A9C9AEC|nr:permease [Leptospira harrisiae]
MFSFVNIFLILVFFVLLGENLKADPNPKVDSNHSNVSNSDKKDKTKKITESKSKHKPNRSLHLKNQKGYWQPMELVWDESSGAVAPEFRFAKQYQLVTQKKKIILSRRVVEKGKLIVNDSNEISPHIYQKWMNSLFQLEINHLPMEEIPKEQLTGVSYNYVSFLFGGAKSKFYYQLEDRKNPDWKQKNSIIQIIERMKP